MRSFVVVPFVVGLVSVSCTLDPTTVDDGGTDSSTDAFSDVSADVARDASSAHPFTVGIQADAPWPLLGGTSGRLGRSAATGPTTSHVRWKYDLGAPILYASPVIDHSGTIYIGATNGRFVALAPSGALQWEVDFPSAIEATAVIAKDGTIYIGANDATLTALSPSGKTLRKALANASIRGGMTIDGDGVVYFSQAAMGGGQWWPDDTLHQSVGGSAAIVAGRLCAGYCWDSAPTRPATAFLIAPGVSALVLDDNAAGFGYGSLNVVAFWRDGSVRWASEAPDGNFISRPTAFGVSASGAVTTLVLNQPNIVLHFTPAGVLDWTYPVVSNVDYTFPNLTAPIVDATDTSYFGVHDGRVIALDAQGALVWSLATGSRASEAFAMGADGTLYFGLADGFVYAIGP